MVRGEIHRCQIDMRSHPRGVICPSHVVRLTLAERKGAGKTGRWLRPQHRVQRIVKNAHGFDRYSRGNPAFPAQWFYGLYVLSPGKRPFLPPLPAGLLPTGVAPGSRRQDHTTSPSAADVSPGVEIT